ncbi:MAG: cytochrome c maturation protein CcmE [Nitrospinae bacterium]|nr:cytochrome c maturation protein CcmE [Nitrospinota bacterium]
MNKKQIKFAGGSLVIVAAIIYLISAGISKSSLYYLTVEELVAEGSSAYNKGMRVEGKVVPGSIVRKDEKMELTFNLGKNLSFVPVTYTGVIPDMFKDDTKVVVEGTFSSNGIFKANTLMTSCPSKYEASKEEGHPGSKG